MFAYFKRILCFLVVACLLTSTLALPLTVHAVGPGYVDVHDGDSSTYHPVRLEAGETYSYRATVNAPFHAFQIQLATGGESNTGSCTIGVFRWQGTYAATVATAPLYSARVETIQDNSWNSVSFAEALPAGEYLFHVYEPGGNVLVWTDTPASESLGLAYKNGIENRGDDAKLQVNITQAVDQPFSRCDPSQDPHIDQPVLTGGAGRKTVSFSDSIGLRLNMAAPFSGVQFRMATYTQVGTQITISVYEWKGSFVKTVQENPKASDRIVLVDNIVQGITFDKLPAGDYLILIHEPSSGPGIYYYTDVTSFEGAVYREGFLADPSMQIHPECTVTFNKDMEGTPYFLPCAETDEGVSGDHVPPPAYVIPSDSLIHTHPVRPDTWVFTDGLGRVSLTNKDVGDPKDNKTVAMFYWTWHIDNQAASAPNNLQDLSTKYPDAMRDYDHELWGTVSDTYFWNEPIYGYYRSDDEWVLRRQAELLTNAGVDVIFADNTNGSKTWRNGYLPLMETWSQAMTDGVETPKVSFMLPFSATDASKQHIYSLYLDIYRENKWPELWYYLDGKPMISAHTTNLAAEASTTEKEILNFFTFRANHPTYTHPNQDKPSKALGQWGWLATFPQMVYYADRQDILNKTPEQTTVGVAMNRDFVKGVTSAMNAQNIMGRSYTSKGYHTEENAKLWGYNFAEQFNYALEVDPQIVFVTGWNEWRVNRYEDWYGTENAFPDQFNDEYSRDLEPSKGDLKDHYYYQFVNFVRQYKGVEAIPTPSQKTTIDLMAGAEQWSRVEPYYAAYIGNTDDRDAQGYGDLHYTETSGRNDIIGAQVARDDTYVYFHVECAENLTPYTDPLWMNLYIDSDQGNQGWNTFEYVLNKSAASAETLVLERFTVTDDYSQTEKVADVAYTLDGRYMTVKIAKADLGLTGDDFTINFSWTDNVHDENDTSKFSGDIMDFYISGDVAPGGRFKYSYISTAENAGSSSTPTETGGDLNTGTEGSLTTGTLAPESGAASSGDTKTGGCASAVAGMSAGLILLAGAWICRKRQK